MSLINNLIPNIILILFPILIYFVYNCYNKVKNIDTKNIIFNIIMFSSIYLCINYGINTNRNELFIFLNIPIIVSYLKNKDKLAVFLSMFIMCYSYFFLNINIYLIFINYIGFFIIYYIYKNKLNNNFIIAISSFEAFTISLIYYLNVNANVFYIFDLTTYTIISLLITILIVNIFNLLDNLSNIFLSISDLEKDKQLKNSLFKLTHEIKNPLAVCKGYLQMMNLDDKDKTEKYIKIIKEEIERSLLIMADFKELNKITINKEYVDINLLIEEIKESLELLLIENNIKINFKNNEELYLNIDYNKIKQVLINIIKNSIEAIDNNGLINITTYISKNKCRIILEDNGIGMDEETLNKLSVLFFTTKKNGTGLGVALSNEIIKCHNGKIKYESEINKGTKVTILLPIN